MAKTMDPAFFVAWRKRMGLTQAQFAAKSGDHLVTVKRWETGARKLPPHIGWIMAAIEHGLEPVGQEAMVEVDNAAIEEQRRQWRDRFKNQVLAKDGPIWAIEDPEDPTTDSDKKDG